MKNIMSEKKELNQEELEKVSGGWAGNPGGDPISYSDLTNWDEISKLYVGKQIFFIQGTTWFIATVNSCYTTGGGNKLFNLDIVLSNNRHSRIPGSNYDIGEGILTCYLHCTFKDGTGI